MISIERDSKSWNVFIVTKTDREGFHHQLTLTDDEFKELLIAMKNKL